MQSRPSASCCILANSSSGNVGRVKHSANKAAAAGKSSRSVVALPKTVNRPAAIDKLPPIESKYSAICRAECSAVPRSSIAPTNADTSGRLFVIGQRPAEHDRLNVHQRQVGVAFQQHPQPVRQPFQADFALGGFGLPFRRLSARRPAGR